MATAPTARTTATPPTSRATNESASSARRRSVSGDGNGVGTPAKLIVPYLQRMPTFGPPGRRVAIVAGLRTPFAKSGTTLKSLSAIELGKRCVAELIQRSEIDATLVEAIIYGTVVPSVLAPNIAREVSLLPLLPK